jgi:hypothetical protein
MPITTERVLQFAKEAFERHVQDVLDDPSWLLEEPEHEAVEWLAQQRLIASELGVDYDELLERGSEFEIRRLRQYEAGDFSNTPLRRP